MQPDEPARIDQGRRDFFERNARRVGREDGGLGDIGLEFSKQGLLDIELLDYRLDDNIGRTDLLRVKIDGQSFFGRRGIPRAS